MRHAFLAALLAFSQCVPAFADGGAVPTAPPQAGGRAAMSYPPSALTQDQIVSITIPSVLATTNGGHGAIIADAPPGNWLDGFSADVRIKGWSSILAPSSDAASIYNCFTVVAASAYSPVQQGCPNFTSPNLSISVTRPGSTPAAARRRFPTPSPSRRSGGR